MHIRTRIVQLNVNTCVLPRTYTFVAQFSVNCVTIIRNKRIAIDFF